MNCWMIKGWENNKFEGVWKKVSRPHLRQNPWISLEELKKSIKNLKDSSRSVVLNPRPSEYESGMQRLYFVVLSLLSFIYLQKFTGWCTGSCLRDRNKKIASWKVATLKMNGQDACTESVCLSAERAVSQGGRQPWRAPCNRPSAAAMTSLTRFYLLTTTWITNGAWYVTFISTFAFSKMYECGPGKLLLFKWDLKSLCDEYGDYILLECNVV